MKSHEVTPEAIQSQNKRNAEVTSVLHRHNNQVELSSDNIQELSRRVPTSQLQVTHIAKLTNTTAS